MGKSLLIPTAAAAAAVLLYLGLDDLPSVPLHAKMTQGNF